MSKEDIVTDLDYVSGKSIIPEDAFGISPSGLHKFFDRPHEWYREMVLGEQGFTGSTASVLGTIVHYIAEQFATTGKVNKSEIFKYLYKETVSDKSTPPTAFTEEVMEEYLFDHADNEAIDASVILDQYKPMGNALIQYLRSNIPSEVEDLISAEIIPGYYACGSMDAYSNGTVIDYKTTSDKMPKSYIPYQYKLQLLTYAWIYKQMGKPVDRMRIVWITRNETNRFSEKTGKPLKDYPSTVAEVTEQITDDDFEFIESVLTLVAETVQASIDYPHLKHVIFRDQRLKG